MFKKRQEKLSVLISKTMYIDDRKRECSFLLKTYTNHHPVFVRYNDKVSRHLIPADQQYTFLLFLIRKARQIDPRIGVMTLLETPEGNSIIPPSGSLISELVLKYKHADGFLYIDFVNENIFG